MNSNYNSTSSVQYSIVNENLKGINEITNILINKYNNEVSSSASSSSNSTIKLMDIGCSHGRNSILILNFIIGKIKSSESLRNKIIEVYHTDLPVNNFTSLFNEIIENENTYLKHQSSNVNGISDRDIFSYGVGNTFLDQLVPGNSIDLIFSFNTFHWSPVFPINELLNSSTSTEVEALYEKSMILVLESSRLPFNNGDSNYFRDYLTKILSNRYDELKVGGVLMCNFLISNDPGFETAFQEIKSIFREMHKEGYSNLTKIEISKMILPVVFYTKSEYEYALDQVNKKGLKLLNSYKFTNNWLNYVIPQNQTIETALEKEQGTIIDELSAGIPITYLNTLISFCGPFIKNSIDDTSNGVSNRKELIFNEFKVRFVKKFKLEPKKYKFSFECSFCQFQKVEK